MNNRSRILASIKTIEDNLCSPITIMDISKDTGFSYYYFNHLFKAITGIGPSHYMSQRKIAHSLEILMSTDRKIIDISLDYGYGSPEAYTRAFSRSLSQSPSDVRKHGLIHGDRLLPPLTNIDILHTTQQPHREPELVTLEPMYLAGIPFYYDLTQKNDLSSQWSNLIDVLDTLPGLNRPPSFYQMQLWFPNQSPDSIYFFIGVGIEKDSPIPIQLTAKTIPSQTYLRFYHKGLSNLVGHTYRYIYEEWLPQTDYLLPHYYNFEYYGAEHLGPYNPNSISEIYIPVELQS